MAATPLFVITDEGLAVASVATPTGPFIYIKSFKVGDAYGYDPTRDDSDLNGVLLYQGVPTSYSYVGDNTIDILCQIPADAGPFDFGEVGLFLDGGVMFAKAVFDTPQTKYSALGTNIVSTYSFHCLLKLEQSVAVFKLDTSSGIPPAVWNVDQWSDVYPPGVSANPDIPLIMVREKSEQADSTLLQNTDDEHWTVGTTYHPYYGSAANAGTTFPVVNAATTWVEVAASRLHPADLTTSNRRFVLETEDGYFRSVLSVVTSSGNYRFNLNTSNDGTYNNTPLPSIPSVGSQIKLMRDDQSGGSIYYSQIIDPPPLPLGTVGTPGLVYGGSGLYMPQPGVIEAHGLLHAPSTNTGRILTSADNLNNTGLNSGAYIVSSGAFGFPANMPVNYDGHIWMQNYDGLITQVWWPAGTGGGDIPSGNNGYPPYFRSFQSSQGFWTNWFPFTAKGKQVPGGGTAIFSGIQSVPQNSNFTVDTTYAGFVGNESNDDPVGQPTTLIINGNLVGNENKQGGKGYGRRQHVPSFFNAGDSVIYRTNNNAPGKIWWWHWPNF